MGEPNDGLVGVSLGSSSMSPSALIDAMTTETLGGDGAACVETIRLAGPAMDVGFHSTKTIVACALITGGVRVFEYDEHAYRGQTDDSAELTPARRLVKLKPHGAACRAAQFAEDTLLTASSDGTIAAIDVEAGKVMARLNDAHPDAVNVLCPLTAPDDGSGGGGGGSAAGGGGGALVASGDDSGIVRIWDLRARAMVTEFVTHDDYISTLRLYGTYLVSASGDGSVAYTDLRRVLARGESSGSKLTLKTKQTAEGDDEVLCLDMVRGGERIIAGLSTGSLQLYTVGDIEAGATDRIPGHPDSVDAIVSLEGLEGGSGDSLVVTGCGDGMLRVVSLFPHQILGVLGEHGTASMPVEVLTMSNRGRYGKPGHAVMASASHDATVRLWSAAEAASSR